MRLSDFTLKIIVDMLRQPDSYNVEVMSATRHGSGLVVCYIASEPLPSKRIHHRVAGFVIKNAAGPKIVSAFDMMLQEGR